MKKVLLLCMTVCLLALGCEKEGVYNPSKKIKRVYYSTSKHLTQEWKWNKNQLQKIDYYWNNSIHYTENFKYDDKNRITKIEDYDTGDYTTISYSDDGYNKIEYYWENILIISAAVKYENKKISRIDIVYYDCEEDKNIKSDGFISNIIPKEIIERVNNHKGTKGAYPVTVTFKYAGDNVSEMTSIEEGYTANYSYENYDKNLNPYFHALTDGFGMYCLSKNNVGRIIYRGTFSEGDTEMGTTDFEYTYDGKFPTEVVQKIGTSRYVNYYEYN